MHVANAYPVPRSTCQTFGRDTKRYLWTFEDVANIGSIPSQHKIFPFYIIDHVHSSPKTPVLLVLPRTVAELKESGSSAEMEEEPRATRQRTTSSVIHDSYQSCAGGTRRMWGCAVDSWTCQWRYEAATMLEGTPRKVQLPPFSYVAKDRWDWFITLTFTF